MKQILFQFNQLILLYVAELSDVVLQDSELATTQIKSSSDERHYDTGRLDTILSVDTVQADSTIQCFQFAGSSSDTLLSTVAQTEGTGVTCGDVFSHPNTVSMGNASGAMTHSERPLTRKQKSADGQSVHQSHDSAIPQSIGMQSNRHNIGAVTKYSFPSFAQAVGVINTQSTNASVALVPDQKTSCKSSSIAYQI